MDPHAPQPAEDAQRAGAPRAALITGGGTGIGRAVGLELARRGFDLYVNHRADDSLPSAERVAAEARALGRRARVLGADVADEEQVARMLGQVERDGGELELLVNSAGYTEHVPDERLDLLTGALVDRVLAVNLKGVLLCTRAALPLLRPGVGHVVNVASTSALDGRGSNMIYCAAKAGVVSLTRSLARSLGPRGVRVNAVCPGFVETRFVEGVPRRTLDEDAARAPLGRLATAEEVGRAVAALHLELTATTGEALVVDCGRLVGG